MLFIYQNNIDKIQSLLNKLTQKYEENIYFTDESIYNIIGASKQSDSIFKYSRQDNTIKINISNLQYDIERIVAKVDCCSKHQYERAMSISNVFLTTVGIKQMIFRTNENDSIFEM